MWIFILFYFLGLNISQATGQGNSTQMYYVKLTIDKNAIGNITDILKPFVRNTTLHVDHLQMTTTCKNVSSSTVCNCEPRYIWSDKVCKSKLKCCGNNSCTFHESSSSMCVSEDSVTVIGSITLNLENYQSCLQNKDTEQFKKCDNTLLKKMKEEYSTLKGFDILTINKYSVGSIIADFEMTIADKVNSQDLINRSENLTKNLEATLILETTGVVHLRMPPNPVGYNSSQSLKCTTQEDLGTNPEWKLKRANNVFDIYNGTVSTVITRKMETEVNLKSVSKLWEGEYTCVYSQTKLKSYTIKHKASAVMDVCLLPDIEITTIPGFPQCKEGSYSKPVTVQCEIESDESYIVSWTSNNSKAEFIQKNSSAKGILVYTVETFVRCNSTEPEEVTCTFTNRCKKGRHKSVIINVINEKDPFCEADGDWEVTKAGFTAVLKCKNARGRRQRNCTKDSSKAQWGPEVSACVNSALYNVLQKAEVVDIGLGSLDGNAADVFSLLGNVTNNTETINTFANLRASVTVLSTLSQKHNLSPNESASNDFLESSSNLLEESLHKSWKAEASKDNASLASKYLSSVEQLIHVSNITGVPERKKKNLEVSTKDCSQGSQCSNTVFNVTVVLESQDPGNVKTVGFKQLEKYLANKDNKSEPNSIVVSTTTTKRQKSDSLQVKIKFQLLKPRPRNTMIECVFWDNKTQGWSKDGCEWKGPGEEGHCTCSHLSSFAVLMSRSPLEVPGINEITYIGLSVSVISLVITLVIELIVWSTVVKTNTLYLRHIAHINISLCLLVADCCFFAASKPKNISQVWCETFAVVMHFCYLAMFFWMLCLSCTLLHQTVFLFHNVSKKNYLRFSLVLGYACPFLIVAITFLANKGGARGFYYSGETCWLVFKGFLKGSIHSFVLPVGIIVFINVFFMLVVIMKLLDHPKNTETSHDKEKKAAKTVMRSIIFLTPVFGVTWIFGFGVLLLDLTAGKLVYAVNYAFVLLNAFQGLFILLVTCPADKLTREALLKRLRKSAPASTTDSITKLDSTSQN